MGKRDDFDTLAPEFRIEIDGTEVPEKLRADLVSVRVLEDVNATGMFSWTVHCWDSVDMKVKWIDENFLNEGKTVGIYMGYRDQMKNLFTGEICALEPDFNTGEAPLLTIRGYDRGHKLMKQKRTASYVQMKDADIARQIASQATLKPEVQDTAVTFEYVLQHNQTDLEFLWDRAARIGYEVFVSDNTLYFRSRKITGNTDLTLRREIELLEFYARSAVLNQVEQVSVQGWNPKQKKEIIGNCKPSGVKGNMGSTKGPAVAQRMSESSATTAVRSPVFSQQEADELATGMLNELALTYITGEGVCIGRNDLRPGRLIKVEGCGQRFSGAYYVTSAEHSYLPSRGYRTAFTVRRNAAE